MGLRLRIALLMVLAAAAAFTGAEAWRGLRPREDAHLPHEIYDAHAARAVYETERARKPLDVTEIELCCLRAADRAMVKAGIPVLSRQELLTLLEDLGS